MSRLVIYQQLSILFDDLDESKRKLSLAEAKFDELQADCVQMICSLRRLLSTETTESHKLDDIYLMMAAFPKKHLNTASTNYTESTAVSNLYYL